MDKAEETIYYLTDKDIVQWLEFTQKEAKYLIPMFNCHTHEPDDLVNEIYITLRNKKREQSKKGEYKGFNKSFIRQGLKWILIKKKKNMFQPIDCEVENHTLITHTDSEKQLYHKEMIKEIMRLNSPKNNFFSILEQQVIYGQTRKEIAEQLGLKIERLSKRMCREKKKFQTRYPNGSNFNA